jgi:hypothetical protein
MDEYLILLLLLIINLKIFEFKDIETSHTLNPILSVLVVS